MKTKGKTARIVLDFSNWHFDGWQQDIASLMEITKSADGIEIEINLSSEAFEKIARKIAAEAIETFVNNATFQVEEGGLWWHAQEMKHSITIPWNDVELDDDGDKAAAAVQKWIDDRISRGK